MFAREMAVFREIGTLPTGMDIYIEVLREAKEQDLVSTIIYNSRLFVQE